MSYDLMKYGPQPAKRTLNKPHSKQFKRCRRGTRIRTPAGSRPFGSISAFLFEAVSEEIVRFQEEFAPFRSIIRERNTSIDWNRFQRLIVMHMTEDSHHTMIRLRVYTLMSNRGRKKTKIVDS